MKTTLEIPDDLFRKAKVKAALEGRKLKDIVTEGLRLVTAEAVPGDKAVRIEFPIIKAAKGSRKLAISDQRIKELDLEADLDRHAASL